MVNFNQPQFDQQGHPSQPTAAPPTAQPPSKPPSKPLVELKGISKQFGNTRVIDQIDLTVYGGEAVAVIGPSGTGKSTILRIIAGLLAPDSGEVWIGGQRRVGLIEDAPDPFGVGMVFQQAALFDSLTVAENVGFLLYQHSRLSHKEIKDLVIEALAKVGLPDISEQYPAELSGGMRKRVSFARAVMANPHSSADRPGLLLYDEPTAGLDPIASTVIEDLIRSVHAYQGPTHHTDEAQTNQDPQKPTKGNPIEAPSPIDSAYIIVTHQESTIRRTADRVVFLHAGRVQWSGSIQEIDSTDNPFVRQFFSAQVEGPIHVTG
ncbi:MAG: ATP-binding cassette domain-containing protein [Cyanobacteria bacterium J06634_5]